MPSASRVTSAGSSTASYERATTKPRSTAARSSDRRRGAQPDAVVEPSGTLPTDGDGRVAAGDHVGGRDRDHVRGRRPPGERLVAGVALTDPDPSHEVGVGGLVGVEVVAQGEEDERVLLDVVPVTGRSLAGLQAAHDLGDEVAVRALGEERIEDQPVRAPIGRQRHVGAVVADPGRERHRTGGVDGDVAEPPLDRLAGRGVVDHRPQPREGVEGQLVAGLVVEGLRPRPDRRHPAAPGRAARTPAASSGPAGRARREELLDVGERAETSSRSRPRARRSRPPWRRSGCGWPGWCCTPRSAGRAPDPGQPPSSFCIAVSSVM